jgi:hypothetical protein
MAAPKRIHLFNHRGPAVEEPILLWEQAVHSVAKSDSSKSDGHFGRPMPSSGAKTGATPEHWRPLARQGSNAPSVAPPLREGIRLANRRRNDDLRESLDEQLKRVRAELDQLTALFSNYDPSVPPERISADWIRGMLEARRRRTIIFGSLFADPAWDMLLDLYAARLEGTSAAVSDLCKGSAVPYTTALRWIGKLEAAGLIIRSDDSDDGRRVWVDLSPAGEEGMKRYFHSPETGGAGF